jgi:hypothetical protein
MVALVSRATWQATGGNLTRAPSWGQTAGLCPGEPFAEQPAAAFCSGVLVDWDLILTADHCTLAFAPGDFGAVIGYYYAEPGRLAPRSTEFVPVAAIVDEELDPEGATPRLDYAWLRLARRLAPPAQPVALYTEPPPLQAGDTVISVGANGGVPIKWDAGGHVQDARVAWTDYFVADADNSAGSSGGGSFDTKLFLTGVTGRGGMDFIETADGCKTTVRQPDPSAATEQFTYAYRAVTALCARDPSASSICRANCGSPCQALPTPPDPPAEGCAVAGAARAPTAPCVPAWVALLIAVSIRRSRQPRIRRRLRQFAPPPISRTNRDAPRHLS